jgi:hypothetical protein
MDYIDHANNKNRFNDGNHSNECIQVTEVFTAVVMKSIIFWVYPEDGGDMFFRNVD